MVSADRGRTHRRHHRPTSWPTISLQLQPARQSEPGSARQYIGASGYDRGTPPPLDDHHHDGAAHHDDTTTAPNDDHDHDDSDPASDDGHASSTGRRVVTRPPAGAGPSSG